MVSLGATKSPKVLGGGEVGREEVLLELGRCLKYKRRGGSWAGCLVIIERDIFLHCA